MVFADAVRQRRLNEILHPAILKRTLAEVARQPSTAVTVVVVPLLFETQFDRNCDAVVAVVSPATLRRQRAIERGLSPADVDARMRTQLPDEEYGRRAQIIIRNEGDLGALEREVDAAWGKIQNLR